MKWVKSSDKMPNKIHDYIVRRIGHGGVEFVSLKEVRKSVQGKFFWNDISPEKYHEYEWLDESEQPSELKLFCNFLIDNDWKHYDEDMWETGNDETIGTDGLIGLFNESKIQP